MLTPRTWLRVELGYLAVISVVVGVWAQAAPRSFYDQFPGLGRTWLAVDGPYNEHFIRDTGGLNLALTVVFVAAAITLARSLVITAAAATAVYGIPHLTYHAVNTDGLAAADIAVNLAGLALFAGLPVAIVLTERETRPPTPTDS